MLTAAPQRHTIRAQELRGSHDPSWNSAHRQSAVGHKLLRPPARTSFVHFEWPITNRGLGGAVLGIVKSEICRSDAFMQTLGCAEDLAYILLLYRNA